MDLDAEGDESHDALQRPGVLGVDAQAQCVLHQSVCVKGAEIDDLFYAFLGISR
jgi:hypothetical protein